MRESGYYPPGAEFDPNAPYNEPSTTRDATVTVSITLSKDFDITVSNEDAATVEDLKKDHYLPDEVLKRIANIYETPFYASKTMIKDCTGWNVDECEVIEN